MEWIECVRCEKLQRDFVAQTFALITPVHPISHWIYETSQMHPTLWNTAKPEFRDQWDGLSAFFAKKLQCDFVARTFALSAPIHPVLHQVCSYEMIPNAPKHCETHESMSLGSNRVDRVSSLRKITTWLRGTNFCINCTSSPRFAPSFIKLWNDPK